MTTVQFDFYPTLTQTRDTLMMALQVGAPAPNEPPAYSGAYPATGWTVGTVAGGGIWSSPMRGRSTQGTGTFVGASFALRPGNSTRNAFRSLQRLRGSFSAGNWNVNFAVQGQTTASTHVGRMIFAIWHGSKADGSDAVQELPVYTCSNAAVSDTTSVFSSGGVHSIGAFTMNNEYLFIVPYWEVFTAGSAATDTIVLRPDFSFIFPIAPGLFVPESDNKGLYTVEIDWSGQDFGYNSNGNVVSAYDDVTQDTVVFKTSRGRDQPAPLISQSTVGQLTLRLRNTLGEYSIHSSGILSGRVKSGLPIRVRAPYPWGGYIWTGYINKIEQFSEIGQFPYVIVTALGTFSKLVGRKISPPVTTTPKRVDEIMDIVLDAADWGDNRTLGVSEVVLDQWFTADIEPLECLNRLFDTELSWGYEGKSGYFIFEHRNHRLRAGNSTTSQALFSDDSSATYRYKGIRMISQELNTYDKVVVPFVKYGIATNANLWAIGRQSGFLVPASGSRPITVEYERSRVNILLSGPIKDSRGTIIKQGEQAEVDTSFVVDWVLPTIANNGIIVANDEIRSYITTTAGEETATRFTFTVHNAFTTAYCIPDYITVRGDVAYRLPSMSVIAGTGIIEYPFPANYYSTLDQAQAAANRALTELSYPRDMVEITIGANRNYDTLYKCLSLELSDRITITATGAKTKLGIAAQPFYVEGIEHEVDMVGHRHTTKLMCSAVNPTLPSGVTAFGTRPGDYAIFNTSTMDNCMMG